MHKRFGGFLLVLILVLVPVCPLWAWNDTGHEAAAWICWQDLKPEVREKVGALLKQHPQYASLLKPVSAKEDQVDALTFLKAATWPDMVRRGEANRAYHHPNWHYVDYPFVTGALPEGTPAPEEPSAEYKPGAIPSNALQALAKNVADLRSESTTGQQKAIALAWIEHLVADIHQPLHAVSRFSAEYPEGDKGGNLIMVNVAGSITNLHSFWDGVLGRYDSFALTEQVGDKSKEIYPRSTFESVLKPGDYHGWAMESLETAKKVAYEDGKIAGVPRGQMNEGSSVQVPELPKEYFEASRDTARRRIALAGYRLADLLNAAMAEPTTKP